MCHLSKVGSVTFVFRKFRTAISCSKLSAVQIFSWPANCLVFFRAALTLTAWFGLRSFLSLASGLGSTLSDVLKKKTTLQLENISRVAFNFQEILESGWVPPEEEWQKIAALPEPWGSFLAETIKHLRSQGASVVPTLKRIRKTADWLSHTLKDARARASQSISQAGLAFLMIPLVSFLFYETLPGISQHLTEWLGLSFVAAAVVLFGLKKLVILSQEAAWGGLTKNQQPWVVLTFCFLEHLLSNVRTGLPADLAWTEAIKLVHIREPDLSHLWGVNLWDTEIDTEKNNLYVRQAQKLRTVIQVNIMDGKPLLERLEAHIATFQIEVEDQVRLELEKLPQRTLKILYLYVAPAVITLMAYGFYLCWKEEAVF